MNMDRDFLVNQAVKRASEAAERTGEVTFDQLNVLLPSDQLTPEIIEQVLNRLAEKGVRVVDE
jgi:RNA polymerase primary sigma factor